MDGKAKAAAKAEQARYDVGMKETEKILRDQVTEVYRTYFLQVWKEALNSVGVDVAFELRNLEKVFLSSSLKGSRSNHH